MKLYICEKPSQAKDLAPHVGASSRASGWIEGPNVKVTWCIGHLVEQAPPESYNPALKSWNIDLLPVLPDKWKLDVKPATASQFKVVQSLLKEASCVVIATDADREGEVIAREVMELCKYHGSVDRLWLSAMDSASIKKSLNDLRSGSKTVLLYQSGLGRARADWLAGMNLTMALTKAFGAGGKEGVMHCGRVQTPVLALIVRRDRAIAAFVPIAFYDLSAVFRIGQADVKMKWLAPADCVDAHGHVLNKTHADAVAARVKGKAGTIRSVSVDDEREAIPLLFSLGSLQREANARFGIKAQATLDACQALYETHKATTYPRTDCEYLPLSMHADAGAVIRALVAADPSIKSLADSCRLADRSRAFNDKQITAHHAIVPTAKTNVDLASMTSAQRTIYDLIRRRYLAQFLGDYLFAKTVVTVNVGVDQFKAVGTQPQQLGWRAALPVAQAAKEASSSDESAETPQTLPPCSAGMSAQNVKAEVMSNKTKPPKRYTEATLLSAMESIDKEIDDPRLKAIMRGKEKAGIGTDATRSSIIEGLFRRNYIEPDKKAIKPTQRGIDLIGLIERVAPSLSDPVLTAQWEDQLSQVEKGALLLEQFESDLGRWLTSTIAQVKAQAALAPAMAAPVATTHAQGAASVTCDLCKCSMRRIQGPKGYFWGCSGWRDGCKFSLADFQGKPVAKATSASAIKTPSAAARKAPVAASEAASGQKCPTCNKGTLIGRTIKDSGKAFMGCSLFPNCKHFQWVAKS